MRQAPDDAPILIWAGITLLAGLVFTLEPGIDLWVSGLFHRAGGGFPLAGWGALERLRMAIWTASEIAIAVALLGLALSQATGGPALWMPARVWGFILALYVLGPGLLVNAILKDHWGRARPDTVDLFGGGRSFTAALDPAEECARNCSFVSGEAAAAVALGLSAALILIRLRPRLAPQAFRRGMQAAAAVAVVGALLRVMVGRHFLSDVMFAALFVIGIALILDRMLHVGLTPRRKTGAGRVLTTPATPPIRRDT